ncbi:MAG: 6,7-dimethyl-8-ribityllumazine synthase [Chthoniobacteraceae bacterium]|nr:6,7-dimethyl-8-ribityllumazine synthase [Chthoniobacteraceae bacterium]
MASRRHFAIVASQYNATYVTGLVENAKRELEMIAPGSTVNVWEVPGAFEIPLVVQEIATHSQLDAIIALGVIIEGETQHAALVGATVTQSLQRLSLAHRVPIIHEVLLVKNEEQARARCLEGELNRGIEAARIAVRMVQVMAGLPRPH